MGVKIQHRQYRSRLERALDNGWYSSEKEEFLRQIVQDSELWEQAEDEPVRIGNSQWLSNIWCYKDTCFEANDCSGFSDEDIKLLIRDALDRERKKIEKLKLRYEAGEPNRYRRVTIPDEVRIFVWQRDGGACVKCGSNQNLEYDHIIPASKGGSNTARNLQLLCEECNRAKSDNI